MSSERDLEGYMMIDHRDAPPVPDWMLRQAGLPSSMGRGLAESATYTCKHCCAVVVLNPDRSRERAWCRAGKHRICDACAVTYARTKICVTFDRLADMALEAAVSGKQQAPRIIIPT
jgi:hypothetical protein